MEIYVILGTVFVSAFLLIFLAVYFLTSRRDPVKARLDKLATEAGVARPGEYDLRASLLRKGMGLFAWDEQGMPSAREWLARGGYFGQNVVYNYYLTRAIFTLVLTAVFTVVAFKFHFLPTQIGLMAGAGALVGFMAPRYWVSRRIVNRREAIRRAVPNMLDLMVVCVEAGLSFTAAINKLAEEIRASCPPLAQEMQIVTHEILIGKPKADAFKNLANRTEVEELRSLAVTLIQADRLGTSIATSLRALADTMRFKRRQRAEESANKVSVKLVFPLVLLIFPELLIILVGPAMIGIYKTLRHLNP
jgi:tight adherence protein C